MTRHLFWRILASSSWAEGVPAVAWNDIDVALWFMGESSITIGWFRRLRPTRPEPPGVRVSPW